MNRIPSSISLAAALAIGLTAATMRAADTNTTDSTVTIEPGASYAHVTGNQAKFREDTWTKDGWTGGIQDFKLNTKLAKDLLLDVDGHALFDAHDYKLRLELTKPEFWFLHAGYTEYRQYFNGNGGYFATNHFGPVVAPANQDLNLDMRNFFVEVGLIRPDLPKITIGYERQEKHGLESLLEWGTANSNKKIWPSYMGVDEHTDIIKLEVEHDIKNVHIGDEFRYEHYQAANPTYDMSSGYLSPYTTVSTNTTCQDNLKNDLFCNTFHVESYLNEQVYCSFGYLFSRFDGDDGMTRNTAPPTIGAAQYYTTAVSLESDSHVLNANLMYDPFKTLSVNVGLQGEMTDQEAFQTAVLATNKTPTTIAGPGTLYLTETDTRSLEENIGVRWTGIPFTTVYAEGKLLQEQQYINYNLNPVSFGVGLLDQTIDTQSQDFKIGFNSSPLSRLSSSSTPRAKPWPSLLKRRASGTSTTRSR